MTQHDLGRLLFGVYDVAAKVQQHCKPGLGWAPCGSGPSSQAGERADATRDPHARPMSSRICRARLRGRCCLMLLLCFGRQWAPGPEKLANAVEAGSDGCLRCGPSRFRAVREKRRRFSPSPSIEAVQKTLPRGRRMCLSVAEGSSPDHLQDSKNGALQKTNAITKWGKQ